MRKLGLSKHKKARANATASASMVVLLFLASPAWNGAAIGAEENPKADRKAASNWSEYYGTPNGWRYSPLKGINKSNVRKLKVAWIHQPGDITNGLQSTPLAIDGVLYYISANNKVQALDATTGKEIWRFQPDLDPSVSDFVLAGTTRGIAIGHGRVYFGTLDGRIIALDQKTGQQIWSNQLTLHPKEDFQLFLAPPVVAGDMLIYGTCCSDYPTAGKIFGVDANTGKVVWTFIPIKEDKKDWPGDSGKVGGGNAWITGTYDAASGTVYLGTGNASPDSYGEERRGDNRYTASVIALDVKTGGLKWYLQETPHDQYDYDSAYEPLLIDRNGKSYVVHLSKNGFVYIMNRADGKLVKVWQFSKYITWTQSVDPTTGYPIGRVDMVKGNEYTICPSYAGGRQWNHGSYSPKTGLWYTTAFETCNIIVPAPVEGKATLATPAYGISSVKVVPPPNGKLEARLDALDPFTGKVKWSVDYDLPGLGCVLATAGGVVFNGDSHGFIHAYDDQTGKELWSFNLGSGIRSGPITYSVKGKQYLVVPSGFPSYVPGFLAGAWTEMRKSNGGAALVAFVLE